MVAKRGKLITEGNYDLSKPAHDMSSSRQTNLEAEALRIVFHRHAAKDGYHLHRSEIFADAVALSATDKEDVGPDVGLSPYAIGILNTGVSAGQSWVQSQLSGRETVETLTYKVRFSPCWHGGSISVSWCLGELGHRMTV